MTTQPRISFELFPPRTPETAAKLPGVLHQLAKLSPEFFSITHGAGGSVQDGTYETFLTVARETGLETAPHLTCIGASREKVAATLDGYRKEGVKRIVALRGDLPASTDAATVSTDFPYALDLVRFIRANYGDSFLIEVAAYPEMHPKAPNPGTDFEHFHRKVEAGANGALTQLFYNEDAYFDFLNRCERANLKIPVVPGIMPITGYANTCRFCDSSGADLPRWIRLRLQELQDDKPALVDFGVEVVTRQCETLLKNGAPALHFFTINQAEPTLRLCQNLGVRPKA